MTDSIMQEPISFASTDTETTIRGYIWHDESCAKPRGIVQIAHGMAEHIGRYDDFARFLASKGFIVGGYDHLAHGDSVSDDVPWGGFDPRDGANHLIEDVHRMRSLMLARTPAGLPYFVFGHSMGSYIMRDYIARHGEGLAGAILCGTGYIAPIVSKAGNALARAMSAIRGKNYKSKLLDHMGVGAFNKVIDDARTEADWISASQENVDRYLADEKSGFMFPAGGYATLTALTREACSPATIQAVPHGLPLLFIAGAEDPVGSMGEGVRKVAAMMQEAGVQDVEVEIYAGMRHEILNEDDHMRVYDDVAAWLDKHVDGGSK